MPSLASMVAESSVARGNLADRGIRGADHLNMARFARSRKSIGLTHRTSSIGAMPPRKYLQPSAAFRACHSSWRSRATRARGAAMERAVVQHARPAAVPHLAVVKPKAASCDASLRRGRGSAFARLRSPIWTACTQPSDALEMHVQKRLHQLSMCDLRVVWLVRSQPVRFSTAPTAAHPIRATLAMLAPSRAPRAAPMRRSCPAPACLPRTSPTPRPACGRAASARAARSPLVRARAASARARNLFSARAHRSCARHPRAA